MSTIDPKAFLLTLKEYLETEGETELLRLLDRCELSFDYTGAFTYRVWNQRSVYLEIRVPVGVKKRLEENSEKLKKYCMDIFPDSDDYALMGIRFGILMTKVRDDESPETRDAAFYSKNQIYDNLITKINKVYLDPIEKDYIYEACLCAKNGCNLAAATMLGCAAEHLLIQLCKSYLAYLKNGNGSEREIQNFEEKVLNAKKAHARLEGFIKAVANKEKLFEKAGLENSNLHFSFLDIIRQVRNESGHPTGIKISPEDLNTIFANYQLLIERVHPLITKLPTMSES
jgi:hypothetical protein